MAQNRALRIGVDAHRRLLPGAHHVELCFFEVGPDPDIIGYEHRQVRARLCILADRGAEVYHTACLVCRDRRIAEVDLCLVALSFCLCETRAGAGALRVQRLDLPLRQFECRLRTVHCGLLLTQLRGVLLGVLNRARDRVRQVFVARRLLLREHQGRLLLRQLGLVGGDLRLLHAQLRGYLGFGLGECRAVCAIIDARDNLAGGDMLIVGDRNSRNVA
jgi:hypothetical protein